LSSISKFYQRSKALLFFNTLCSLLVVPLLIENENIMKALNKTKQELIKELQKLQKEHTALQEKYEKDIGNHEGVEEKLTISETNYRRLFETAKDGIMILDAETGMITDVNPFLVELLGYSKSQFIEKKIWEIGFFKDIIANHDKFLELQQKGYVRYEDLPLESIDGRKIRVEFVSNVYLVNHHNVIQCNIRDISNRKQVENTLRESEEKYSVLFEGSTQGISAADIETHRFLFSNPAICQMFGYTDAEFLRLNITDLSPKDSLDYGMSEFESQVSGEKPISFALPLLRKDGTVFYADVAGTPIIINGRKCIVGFFTDATERKRAEDALKESEQKYRNIFENIQNVYYETSLDGTILEISPSIYILSKRFYRREDLLGQNMFEFYSDPERRKILLQELRKMERLEDFDIELKNQDGSLTQVALTCRLIRDENKQPKKIIGSMRNITERKQFEMELIIAKERAEESDRLKSVFLANMSHEIRTPMNGILGFAELLKEPHLTDGEQQQYISIIEKSGKRMLNIIGDIVSISKIESGQMEISSPKQISMNKSNTFIPSSILKLKKKDCSC